MKQDPAHRVLILRGRMCHRRCGSPGVRWGREAQTETPPTVSQAGVRIGALLPGASCLDRKPGFATDLCVTLGDSPGILSSFLWRMG